jgi:hypothetical protein
MVGLPYGRIVAGKPEMWDAVVQVATGEVGIEMGSVVVRMDGVVEAEMGDIVARSGAVEIEIETAGMPVDRLV